MSITTVPIRSLERREEFYLRGLESRSTVKKVLERELRDKSFTFTEPHPDSCLKAAWPEDIYSASIFLEPDAVVNVTSSTGTMWVVKDHAEELLRSPLTGSNHYHLAINFEHFLQARQQWYKCAHQRWNGGPIGAYVKIARIIFFVMVSYDRIDNKEGYVFKPYDFEDSVIVTGPATPIFYASKKVFLV